MAEKINWEDFLKGLEENGAPEGGSSNVTESEQLVKIIEIETSVGGPDCKFKECQTWSPGPIIKLHCKILEGEDQGARFYITKGLLGRTGKLALYTSFKGSDGEMVPGTVLGEIIHRIKEQDEKQWDDSLFKPSKFIDKEFSIGIRRVEGRDGNTYYIPVTEYQLWKDKEYKAKQEEAEKKLDSIGESKKFVKDMKDEKKTETKEDDGEGDSGSFDDWMQSQKMKK